LSGLRARRHTIRVSALAFLCGILLIQQLPVLPSLWWSLLLLPVAGLAQYKRSLFPVVIFVCGALWVTFRAGLILADALDPSLEGKDLQLVGIIADIPHNTEQGVRIRLDIHRALVDDRLVSVPATVELSHYGFDWRPRAGEKWRLVARLKRPHGFQNPGGFDYEGYLFQHRIRATGYVRNDETPVLLSSAPEGLLYRLGRLRQNIGEAIDKQLAGHAHGGIITALANGDQHAIEGEHWDVLRRTGTAHLVAISGQQVSLVAGLVFFLARWFWALPGRTVLWLPAPLAGALAALLAGAVYAALAGFSFPTQRALIMLAMALAGILTGRQVAPSRLLAAALLVVLLLDPLAVMASGFWLSFLAVGAILYVAVGRTDPTSWRGRWRMWSRTQWAVTLGLTPLLLLLFQQTSLSAPLANLIAIPVTSFIIVPATLLGVLSLSFSPATMAPLFLHGAAWAFTGLWSVLEPLANLPYGIWSQFRPGPWPLFAAAVGILLLLAPRGWPGRWFGFIWLLPLFFARPPGPGTGEVWFTLLDVGQGLAAVIRTHNHTLVYDTGPAFSDRFDTGRAVVVPYLREAGVARPDMLIISHGDNDHIGGARSLIQDMPPASILSSVPDRVPGAAPCIAPRNWEWDGVHFSLIHPVEPGPTHNNNSCVLHVRGAHGSLLLPGDIEHPAEAELISQQGDKLRADVLVAPHHGSKTSSTTAFIDHIRPNVVLFPVGYRNRYHHPHPQVLARYQQGAGRMYTSSRHGTVDIRITPRGMAISAYRELHRRYWYSE
jgi:competence protein ComEC